MNKKLVLIGGFCSDEGFDKSEWSHCSKARITLKCL